MIPKLRFPEFIDEWQIKKLGGVFDVRDGTHESPLYLNAGKPLVTSKNLNADGTLDLDNISYISQEDFNNINKRSKVDVGDVLFGMIGTIGNPVRVMSDDFAIKNVALIKQKDVPTAYLIHYLKSSIIAKQFYQKNSGGTQKFIALGDIRNLSIKISSKPEQEKIAEFLMTVDERIALMEKKLELLRKYKKGVMQKIFTQQIRFKDENGDLYPDWEEKKVIDIYHFRSTNSLSRDYLSDVGKYQNIHYGDIHKRYGTHLDTATEDIPRIYKAPQVLIEKFIPESTLNVKDVIMADASEDYKDIGKSLEIINTEGITVAGLHTIVMRPYDSSSMVLGFGAYLFNSERVHRQIMKLATGVSVLGVSLSNLMNVKMGIPNREEQRKIVSVLTALDDKIKEEESRLEFAKQWKKGLLQRMFV